MQSGEYIVDRWMPGVIKEICERRGVAVRMFSGDWLIRLSWGDKKSFVIGYKFGLNDSAAASIAQDKVATYALLQAAELPAIPHILARTKAADNATWKREFGDVFVVKPLIGTSGHGVSMFHSADEAEVWMRDTGIEAWAVSPFVDIEREIRFVLLDDTCLLAYEKQPATVQGLKMFNLGKGAVPRDIQPDNEMVALAQAARQALGLRLCAVDIVVLADRSCRVLEVNEGVMMEHYMRVSEQNKQRARAVYEAIIEATISG